MPLNPAEIQRQLRRVPRFRDAETLRWQPLRGGVSNVSVRVQADDGDYAVRLPSVQAAGIGRLSPRDEWQVLAVTSAQGLAPRPEWCDEHSGLLVTRFQRGPSWNERRMHESDSWPRLAGLLRNVHAIDLALPSFAPVAAARAYWAQYTQLGEPSALASKVWQNFLTECDSLCDALEPVCLCHNDVICSNLVGERPVLLDWEFAARSDPLFDLATVVVYHGLNASQGDALLDEYRGGHDSEAGRRLGLLCRLCRYLSWLWNLARLGREPVAGEWTVALPA